jgi:hypothetical protein
MNSQDPTLTWQRTVPVRLDTDVFVAGGGPAGVAAALAAAGEGARVLLVESQACLGGMGTAGMVPAFMQFGDGINFLADGVGRRILDGLRAADGTVPPDGFGIRAEVLKRVYDGLLEDAGVAFRFYCQFIDAVRDSEGTVQAALCAGKSGLFAVRARAFVDATGDGDLAVRAGADVAQGDEHGAMMPGTLCSLWAGIDWDAVREGGLGAGGSRLEEAFADGVFTQEDRHLPGMWRVGGQLGGGNIGHTFELDGTDEASLTRACVRGRRILQDYDRYYRHYLKGFERMELVATGALLGVRETRRILGDYVLDVDDFTRRAVFDDEIGRYSYPVDIHIARPDRESYEAFRREFTSMRLGRGESYGIPYRILTPRGLRNVLVAGRCVSTDRSLQASIRVMPGCYITGQAAGVAAALMAAGAADDSHCLPVRRVQERLLALGAYLPNAGVHATHGGQRHAAADDGS